MVEGMANQMYVAAKKPNTPCVGLAAMRDCHDAWSQNVMDAVAKKPCTQRGGDVQPRVSLKGD